MMISDTNQAALRRATAKKGSAVTVDFEKMHRDLVDRLPQYERARKVIVAHIDTLERGGGLFTWAPIVDGTIGHLAPATEERCGKAVVKELGKCLTEIDAHIKRVRDLQP